MPPTLTPADLCAVFRDRASAVHQLVRFSYSTGLGVSEETLTDVTLVEIERRLAPHVLTRKYTKHEESKVSGADWLWTIGRPGRWLSLLVQAKLARPSTKRIAGLHHGKGDQRRTLVRYASQIQCVPLYLVYSGFQPAAQNVPAPSVKPQRGTPKNPPSAWKPSCPVILDDITQMGCVAVRPRHVALMYRSNKQREDSTRLLNSGKPWACMFCCPGLGSAAELADALLLGLSSLPIDAPGGKSPGGGSTPEPDDAFELGDRYITAQPPQIVRDLLAGREPEEVPPVSAVAVISAEPLDVDRRPHFG